MAISAETARATRMRIRRACTRVAAPSAAAASV
jgi:hypothetical protein